MFTVILHLFDGRRAQRAASRFVATLACCLAALVGHQAVANDENTLREAAFQRAIDLYRQGDELRFNGFFGDLLWGYSGDPRMQKLLSKVVSPLALVNAMARRRADDWQNRPSEVPPVTRSRPGLPEFEEQPSVLHQDQFETGADFSRRLRSARNAYEQRVRERYEAWHQEQSSYEAEKDEYKLLVEREKAERAEKAIAMREQLMYTALGIVLGTPVFGTMQYEAEREVFVGRLLSSKDNYSRKIEIQVPLQEAPDFNHNLAQARAQVSLRNNHGVWSIDGVLVEYNGRNYVANWSQLPEIPALRYERAGAYGNPPPAGDLWGSAIIPVSTQ